MNYLSLTDIGGEPLNLAFTDTSKSYNNALNFLVVNDDNNIRGKIDLNAYKGLALISGPVTVNGVGQDNEVIDAGNGATFNLRNGGSSIVVAQGGSTINGGTGVDTVILSGTSSSGAHVTKDNNGVTHITMPSQGSTDLTGVERIQFTDGTLALDTGAGSAPNIASSLYSILGREGDARGLGYWINELEADSSSYNVRQQVISVLFSSEFTNKFGPIVFMPFLDAVNLLYINVLHRLPDAEGLAYWRSEFFRNSSKLGQFGAELDILTSIVLSKEAMGISAADNADGLFYKPW